MKQWKKQLANFNTDINYRKDAAEFISMASFYIRNFYICKVPVQDTIQTIHDNCIKRKRDIDYIKLCRYPLGYLFEEVNCDKHGRESCLLLFDTKMLNNPKK
ncbi:hypothetical protein [Sporosarcina jiandibaonis]|uniref:hypothetical protein n=1 Tax=Sporosarcina jiandibaonis TaxID=2715535 RepID=UPI0015549967|nr:hypothetical protein [Sporosarcina jiandibaonis]